MVRPRSATHSGAASRTRHDARQAGRSRLPCRTRARRNRSAGFRRSPTQARRSRAGIVAALRTARQTCRATLKETMHMKTTGRCLCGAIQYEYEGEPLEVAHCHCESCRRQTSSPIATFVTVTKAALRFTQRTAKGVCLVTWRASQLLRRLRGTDRLLDRATGPTSSISSRERWPIRRPYRLRCTRTPPSSSRGSRSLTTCRATRCQAAARHRCGTAREGSRRSSSRRLRRGVRSARSRAAARRCRSAAAGRSAAADPPSSPATG